jgi:two-component system, NarL family, response regulator NreC
LSVRVLIVAGNPRAQARLRRLVESDLRVAGGVGNADQVGEAVERLLSEAPDGEVLVAADQADAETLRAALASGASGYLFAKPAPDTADPAPAPREPDSLTSRQRDVLRLLALGHTNQEIAEMLGLSVRTVETHRAHLMQKLRASSRADLVRYAIDRGLLSG